MRLFQMHSVFVQSTGLPELRRTLAEPGRFSVSRSQDKKRFASSDAKFLSSYQNVRHISVSSAANRTLGVTSAAVSFGRRGKEVSMYA